MRAQKRQLGSKTSQSQKRQRNCGELEHESESELDMDVEALLLITLRSLEAQHGPEFHNAAKIYQNLRISFSKVKYATVAQHFGVADTMFEDWPEIPLPEILLPDHLHRQYCQNVCRSFANPGFVYDLENKPPMLFSKSTEFPNSTLSIWWNTHRQT
ncbi:hypothetical protein B0H12DRAFT_407736 [Mycena haematopus]|nr:hypothetical protein B0H12DRAFT_407736 [Mycena haematopus]